MQQLRNKFISLQTKIKFININNYLGVIKYKDLSKLRDITKRELNLNKGDVFNKATGICAKITKETVNKIIFPTNGFNGFNKKYIDNLNAS